MAGTAGILCGYMPRRFTHCRAAVMAGAATACAHAKVVKPGSRKGDGGMAAFATERGLKMLRWLDHISLCKLRTVHMTRGTGSRRSLENSIDMTRFARCIGVHARERESGFDVVKVFIDGLGMPAGAEK